MDPQRLPCLSRGLSSPPEGVISQLVLESLQTRSQSRLGIDPRSYNSLRYTPLELLKDAQDLLDVDEEVALYVMLTALQSTLDVYYRLQRRWSVAQKNSVESRYVVPPC